MLPAGAARGNYLGLHKEDPMKGTSPYGLALALLLAPHVQSQPDAGSDLIAIDVLLEPDTVLMEQAKAVNARLQQSYPKGFALDAKHAPHVTLVQRFVRAKDLQAIAAAVAKAASAGPQLPLELHATSYETVEWDGLGLLVLLVGRSSDLIQLAGNIVQAVQPFAVNGGTPSAFVKSPGEAIHPKTVDHVEHFVPASSGDRYLPHVTVGAAQPDFARKLQDEPFKGLPFRAVNIAIFQLGDLGTAQKRLWTWHTQSH
jgi:hypothetical protein